MFKVDKRLFENQYLSAKMVRGRHRRLDKWMPILPSVFRGLSYEEAQGGNYQFVLRYG